MRIKGAGALEFNHGEDEMNTALFNSIENSVQTFKGLADENRLRMVGLLCTGELCVCDIMAVLDLPQSTASRHLSYLKNSGLVTSRRRGKWMYYKLSSIVENSSVSELVKELVSVLPEMKEDQKQLEIFLEKKNSENSCSED